MSSATRSMQLCCSEVCSPECCVSPEYSNARMRNIHIRHGLLDVTRTTASQRSSSPHCRRPADAERLRCSWINRDITAQMHVGSIQNL